MGSFDKKPQEVLKDPVLFVWLEMFSSLTISCHIFLGGQYPKRYRKCFCCEPFDAKHPKRYQNCLVNP